MSNLLIICIVYAVVVTINVITKVLEIWSFEKRSVAMGKSAFSNFVYYYEIIPYTVGLITLVIISYYSYILPNPNTVVHIVVFTGLVAFFYFLVGVIAVFIISVVEANIVRKRTKENESQDE